ncbi:hypothetical protein [Catenulispora pinisilvae]|uniref:hypothetical protein n=1 Tax=Catenulispora pinisilvae TaxID=2705253 RepID=UPI001891E950|nr:hypothetical protein [Catenulispora pinisilvae]
MGSTTDPRPDRTPRDWASARPLLRPVPRPADFDLDAADDTGVQFPSRPIAPCLSEFIGVDLSVGMGYVTTELVAGWGVSVDEVVATAHANLGADFRPLVNSHALAPDVTYLHEPGDGFFSSLPLLGGWITAWAESSASADSSGWGERRPVFLIPQRNALLIAPEPTDAEQLLNLLAAAEREWQGAERPLSPVLYTCDAAGQMIPYDLPEDSPFRGALRRSWNLLADSVYAGQTEYLRAKAEFGDPFVAALQRFVDPGTGASFTVATWAEDLEMTLLPEADWIAIATRDNERFFVPWDDVARECPLVPDPRFHPIRYYVQDWPEPQVMRRLQALAAMP